MTEASNARVSSNEILVKGLTHGMSVLGEKFRTNKIFVPVVLAVAIIMHTSLDILKHHLMKENIKNQDISQWYQ